MVPASSLTVALEGPQAALAGDMLSLTVTNEGMVDTSYTAEAITLTDGRGAVLYSGATAGDVLAGEKMALTQIQIPAQTANGTVFLYVKLKDAKTGVAAYLSRVLDVSGVAASTGKTVYLSSETVSGVVAVTNDRIAIDGGVIDVEVARQTVPGFKLYLPTKWWPTYQNVATAVATDNTLYATDATTVYRYDVNGSLMFKWGSAGSGDGQFTTLSGVAVTPSGDVYALDMGNSRIQKFDANGNFLAKWGSKGAGDGQMTTPRAMAVDPQGYIYVADTGNHRIQKFDSSGNFISKWGGLGAGDGQFNYPYGVATGPDGTIYVADELNHRIQRFDGNGLFLGKWGVKGTLNGQFNYPQAIATGADGMVYVADTNNNRIQKFDASGGYVTKWGTQGAGNGQFNGPRFVSVSGDGYIYVTDSGNARLEKFNDSGGFVAAWENKGGSQGHFNGPHGIAVTPDGHTYVADTSNQRIQAFDSAGNVAAVWGKYGTAAGQFNYPYGVAVGGDGSVYVADTFNNRIQRFDYQGNYLGAWGGSGNGDGQFLSAMDIAVGPDNSIYVLDFRNGSSRIQKFDSNGNFISKWGSYGTGDGQFKSARGVTACADGSVYVTDTGNGRIQRFNADGGFVSQWPMSQPWSITCSRDGYVYATTISYSAMHVFKFDQNGRLVAKLGGNGYDEGEFISPMGMTAGPDGSVYVSDSDTHRIQRMTGSGERQVLFASAIPVTQAGNTTQNYPVNIGALNASGKLYLEATLKNSLGQTVAASTYPFYASVGNAVLLFSADKKIYKPGETVTITGEAMNLGSVSLDNTIVSVSSGTTTLFSQVVTVSAGGNYPFTVAQAAGADGTVTLSGSISHGGVILSEAADRYEVATPMVSLTVTAPDVVGREAFDLNVEIKNTGKIDAAMQVNVAGGALNDVRQLTIQAGSTQTLQYGQQISSATVYNISASGDATLSASKTVSYGEAALITISAAQTYQEGDVSIPVIVADTGAIDEEVAVTYQLSGADGIVVANETRTYYLMVGGSVSDAIFYNITKGAYTLTAKSASPVAQTAVSFIAAKKDDVAMGVTIGSLADGSMPVTVGLANIGVNEITGVVTLSLIGSGCKIVWSGEAALSNLASQGAAQSAFNLDTSVLPAGVYVLSTVLYDAAGRQIQTAVSNLTVKAPSFNVTPPSYAEFAAGSTGTLNFVIRNDGDQEGDFTFVIRSMDTLDAQTTAWLKPGEEKTLVFDFNLPADIEAKDYFADYELKGVDKGQVKFGVKGVNISVTASLDKTGYVAGETAMLALNVIDNDPGVGKNLFARVNYDGYEETRSFTLGVNPSVALAFNVPLSAITGEKLFYGIYYDTGRSIHLNSLYIYDAGAPVVITTDKQVYNPGETVAMTITGTASGNLTLDGPGGYSETFAFSGSASTAITLSTLMTAGTYPINWRVVDAAGSAVSGTHAIDVAGIQVKVREATLDKAKYASTDNIKLSLTIESNTDLAATIKTWIAGPDGGYTPGASIGVNLVSSGQSSMVSLDEAFSTTVLGIHRLVYGVYSGEMLLTSGAEVFDVGDAVLLGLATDKSDYPNGTEAVNAAASLFGNASGTMELFVDGVSVGSETVAMNGFTTVNSPLAGVVPGSHTLKAVLTSGGLTSTKETSFVYGTDLADLVVMLNYGATLNADNTISVTVTVVNQGKLPSTATTVTIYDGSPSSGGVALKTFDVPGLAPGESVSFTYELDAMGRAGAVNLYASTANVYEFDSANNDTTASTQIPELAFYTSIPSSVHYAGDGLPVDAVVTNLSKAVVAGAELETVVKDADGNVVYTASTVVPAIAAQGSVTVNTTWSVPDDTLEGDYAVSQQLMNGQSNYGSSVQTVHILPGKDFTLSSVASSLRVEAGGEQSTEITLLPIRGFTDAVMLSVSGAPQGVNVSLTQETMTPSEAVGLKVVSANGAPAGSYILTITSAGGGRMHTLELNLDITDFSMTVTSTKGQVLETETGEFAIELNPLNGFDGAVIMDVTGLPKGMRAAFDINIAALPAMSRLMLRTSKWLRPGVYPIKLTAKGTTAYHEETVALTVVANPEIAPGIVTTPGPGPQNEAVVKTFKPDGAVVASFTAFDGIKYGANAVAGDLNGDGIDEIIVAEGPDTNGLSSIRVFTKHGAQIASMELQSFVGSYGLTLAVGDIDGDWAEELIVGSGPDPKVTGLVKVYKYDAGVLKDTGVDLYPYSGYGYKYGVNVAVADIDGDGRVEIVTAPGPDPNAPAKIKAFRLDASAGIGALTANESTHFNANFSARDGYGANVAACDLNGDGVSEIIVAAGPDPNKTSEVIRAYNVNGTLTGTSFTAYDGYRYGAYVSCGDIYLDGSAEIVTGAGPDPKNRSGVRIFSGEGALLKELQAYPDATKYGVKPMVGRVGVQ